MCEGMLWVRSTGNLLVHTTWAICPKPVCMSASLQLRTMMPPLACNSQWLLVLHTGLHIACLRDSGCWLHTGHTCAVHASALFELHTASAHCACMPAGLLVTDTARLCPLLHGLSVCITALVGRTMQMTSSSPVRPGIDRDSPTLPVHLARKCDPQLPWRWPGLK